MKDNTTVKAIILVVITAIVVLISLLFGKETNNKSSEISIVTNPSTFYTVNSCVYRYITYLSNGDIDSIMLVLDKNYIKDNNINKTNVLELLNIGENNTFTSKKMYYQQVNKNITKFYVYGNIQPNQIFDDTDISSTTFKEEYFIVYLDSINSTFAIEPYDGSLFLEGDDNE